MKRELSPDRSCTYTSTYNNTTYTSTASNCADAKEAVWSAMEDDGWERPEE